MRIRPLWVASVPVLLLAGFASACDRGLAPFDPTEEPAVPDLTRIFPEEAASRANPTGGSTPPAREAPAVTGDGGPVRGEVRIGSELADRVPADALLFVIARAPGGGPPLAVKRVETPAFPYRFEITSADRMIAARPFAGPFSLSAWIDNDGNVMTRVAGDLQGEAVGDYAPGDTGVEIVIDEAL